MEGTAAAFLFSGLAPSLLITAIWHDARLDALVFAFTAIISLSHTVILGLPIYLICLWRRWVNVWSCVFLGGMIGAIPAGLLTFQAQRLGFHASPGMDGLWTIADKAFRSAAWVSCIKPLMYCGLLGALAGLVFWTALTCCGVLDRQ
jgi:hypothetical protein